MQDPKHLWMQLAAVMGDGEKAREACAEYARSVLACRDLNRIRFIGAPKLRAAAENNLNERDLTALILLIRACERRKC